MYGEAQNKIRFHYQFKTFRFKDRILLKTFLINQFAVFDKKVEAINYIFCDDDYLLQINENYLKHETLTDIITFELSPPQHALLADVFISIPRVRENAKSFKSAFNQELHRVIFHGMLHLCGYGDKTAKQAQAMRNAEDALLSKYFVPRGTTLHKLNMFPVKQ